MKIGIIGSGIVGRTLGKGFANTGHEVKMGTRDINKDAVKKWLNDAGANATAGSFEEAAMFGEVLVLCTQGAAALEAIDLSGKNNFSNKIVIDTTNPIAAEPPVNGVLKYFTDQNDSLGERIQKHIPGAHVVKCFSCVGNVFMVHPKFAEGAPTMFICGNNADAKKIVTDILHSFGWSDVEDCGAIEASRAIEPLCTLWCIPGFLNNTWHHALKLVRK